MQLLVISSNLCLFLLILLSYQCYLYSIEKASHSHILTHIQTFVLVLLNMSILLAFRIHRLIELNSQL